MNINGLDSVLVAVADLNVACAPYKRLGVRWSDAHGRTFHVGNDSNRVAVHFLDKADKLDDHHRQGLAAGRPLFAVVLRVQQLDDAVRHLTAKGVAATTLDRHSVWVPLHEYAGCDIMLVDTTLAPVAASEHTFPLKRLDHLAAVTHDLEAKTRFWTDVFSVPVVGELTTPTMVIRQLRIGDVMMELLGPTSADSPLMKRPAGLVSMASWEVADLEAVVVQARKAGFSVPDPATGVLPGTRIATIQGTELAGVNMQLLQYV